MSAWVVVGDGPVGWALADVLAGAATGPHGPNTSAAAAAAADGLVVAVTNGRESQAIAQQARKGQLIVDLTTHSVRSAARASRLATTNGADYIGGGLTGGVEALRRGDASLVVGPGPLPPPALSLLTRLGSVQVMSNLEQAVAAKLLHNWCLLAWSWTLAGALAEADNMRMLDEFVQVLERGTVGRRLPELSIVRDLRANATSSYTARLADKDLAAIVESFPVRTQSSAPLAAMHAAFVRTPNAPFTRALHVAQRS